MRLTYSVLEPGPSRKAYPETALEGLPVRALAVAGLRHFSAAYKARLLSLIVERFKVATELDIPTGCPPDRVRVLRLKKNRELFYLCYHHVGSLSPSPLIFNAQYGLFRCLFGMFTLLVILSITGLIWAWFSTHSSLTAFGAWAVFLSLATFVAYARCKRRSEDFAQSVYDSFLASAPAKPDADQS